MTRVPARAAARTPRPSDDSGRGRPVADDVRAVSAVAT